MSQSSECTESFQYNQMLVFVTGFWILDSDTATSDTINLIYGDKILSQRQRFPLKLSCTQKAIVRCNVSQTSNLKQLVSQTVHKKWKWFSVALWCLIESSSQSHRVLVESWSENRVVLVECWSTAWKFECLFIYYWASVEKLLRSQKRWVILIRQVGASSSHPRRVILCYRGILVRS